MRQIFTPIELESIYDIMSNAIFTIDIYMGINHYGKVMKRIIEILEDCLKRGVIVKYVYEKRFSPGIIYMMRLKKYSNFFLSSRSSNKIIDHVKFINIDNKQILVGSVYFSDDMLKYHDSMVLFETKNENDFIYIKYLNPNIYINNKFVFINNPMHTSTNDDFINFIKLAKYKIIIIMPYIFTLFKNIEIINYLKQLQIPITIYMPKKTNSIAYDVLHSIEMLNGKLKSDNIIVINTKTHFHYKYIIIDDIHLMFCTGNISALNNNIFDINIKLYNNIKFINNIYNHINDI